jgi:alpha-tubulin suppressor-like RCC1 family protein
MIGLAVGMLFLTEGIAPGADPDPEDLRVFVWGDNSYQQQSVPGPNSDMIAISAGFDHCLALRADGSIAAWGKNDYGQCDVPPPNEEFTAVSAGQSFSLGLKADGSILAWGRNTFGQCEVPLPNEEFAAISAGYDHALALKEDGSIVAWGRNQYGQCSVPFPNTGFIAVSAGGEHSLALRADGSAAAWGHNDTSQCNVPLPNADFTAVSAGYQHSLGLKSDTTIVAWGSNYFKQRNIPSPNAGFTEISAGFSHSLGLRADGSVAVCGFMMKQTPSYKTLSKTPTANFGFMRISAGHSFNLGLKSSGGALWIGKSSAQPGSLENQDQIQFSGLMDATTRDLAAAGEIVVSIDAEDMAAPSEWVFPINSDSFRNGQYNYTIQEGTSQRFLKINPSNSQVQMSAKGTDLTGLACPITVQITIGDYSPQTELSETVVNGSSPCPPQFLMGVRDFLAVSKVKVKDGAAAASDSLSINGWFAMEAEPGTIDWMTVDLGGQVFIVPGGLFVYSRSSWICSKADTGSGFLSTKFDAAKCTFSILLKSADLLVTSGTEDLEITIQMDTGTFSQTVEIPLGI